MKDSFVFYRDWLNVMEQLPAEIQLELYQAVAQYALNGKTPTLSPMAKIAFGFIQQTLDRDEDKYHKTVVSSKVSGRMGNLKRWHKDLYQKVLKGALSLEDAEDIAQAMKKSPPDKKNRPPIRKIAPRKIYRLMIMIMSMIMLMTMIMIFLF